MRWRDASLVAMVYVVAAAVVTFPLIGHLTDRLGAPAGVGDPFLNLWILGWGLRAWTSDPVSVLNGRVFDANIFFPAEGTLAYSDHFLLQSFVLAPVFALTGNAVLCYNLLVLGSLAISGLAMHVLVRSVTGSTSAAFLAGMAWACWPYRIAHLLHIQLQALYFMPLAVLMLHKVIAKRRWRDVVLLALTASLQAIASVYYGVMIGIVLAVAAIVLAAATGQWRSSRLWSRIAVAGAMSVLLTIPVAIPYFRSQQSEGFGRTMYEAGNHSAALQSYRQVPPTNLVYGATGWLRPRAPSPGERDRTTVEHQLFPGFVVLVLAAVGLLRHWRSDAAPLARSALALAVIGFVLSLGPEGWRGLYATLHDNLFGFQAVRAPARFSVITMLGLILLASVGLGEASSKAEAYRQSRGGGWSVRAFTAACIAAMCIEYLNTPIPLAAAPPQTTAAGQWLRSEPTPGAVVHVPLTIDVENTAAMVQSLEHGRPIVNGYSGQRPAFFSAIVDSLAMLPAPEALATLRELDVRFLVSPTAIAGVGDVRSPLVERARFERTATEAAAVIYELRWTPEAVAALSDANSPPPPLPGAPPFRAGERLIYEVSWDGGPVNLPAGLATLEVIGDTPHWVFEARAETANWVSPFFQARDRFTTTTDGTLFPLEHQREIREGRRQLDRTYVFDRAARVVRVGASRRDAADAGALSLPLDPVARDALSALYYVRALSLTSDTQIVVPLNEAGTPMVLHVAVAERETIEFRGQSMRVLRVEPRVMRRIERRRPVAMTLWISDDERRVPVRVVVEAGFGRVNAQLVEYRR